MSVSMFANALRTHSRLRVLTATRVALPATRSISSLVAFRTVPKNVSLSASRSFTTSQVARNDDYADDAARPPANCTVFVANIPWSATEDDLRGAFSEFGLVTNIRIHMNPDGRPRGICHIDFENKDSALAAVESATQEPLHLLGRDLRVDFSAGKNKVQQVAEPSEKLYFSGCSGDENEIRNIFKHFSDSIIDIHLLKDPTTGERIPTGFVQLNSVEAATEAMEAVQGTLTPDGEPLLVSYARPRRFQSFGFSEQSSRRGSSGGSYGGNRTNNNRRSPPPRWN